MTQCSVEPRAGLELEVVHLQHLYLPDISDFFGLSRTPTVRRSDLRRTNTPSLTCPCGFDRAAAQPELVYSPQLITRPCGCSSARLMPPERTGGEHMELVMILFWFCKGVWTHFYICMHICNYRERKGAFGLCDFMKRAELCSVRGCTVACTFDALRTASWKLRCQFLL